MRALRFWYEPVLQQISNIYLFCMVGCKSRASGQIRGLTCDIVSLFS